MSKKQDKRIFGMTTFQLAVLGILSVMAITVIFGGFIYISSASHPSRDATFFPTAEQPMPAQPEIVSEPIISLADPVSLPFIATDAPLPADWVQYSNVRIELWVPPQFKSEFPDPERQKRAILYRQQGYEFLASELERGTFDYRFWFNFPQPDTVLYKTRIIVKEDILPTETLDEYVTQTYASGLQGFEFLGSESVMYGDLEFQRILMTATQNGLAIGVADYVITDGVNLWVISCGSSLDEFYDWLPQFDRIALSFRLVN